MTALTPILIDNTRHSVRESFVIVMPGLFSHASIIKTLKMLDLISIHTPQNFNHSLDALNLKEKIEKQERERAAKFFDPANLERVGRRAGKFDFVQQLTDMTQNPSAYTEKQKLKMLQFVSDQYNDHIGAPRTDVKLYDGPPDSAGYINGTGRSIFVNRKHNSFAKDFADLIDTVVHENTHNLQQHPNAFSDPVLSRIYRDNLRAYKSVSTHGMDAYMNQPVEIGAFAAGGMAKAMVRQLAFGANDNAVRTSPHARSRPNFLRCVA